MKLFLITCLLAVVFAGKIHSSPIGSDDEATTSSPDAKGDDDEGAANVPSGADGLLPKDLIEKLKKYILQLISNDTGKSETSNKGPSADPASKDAAAIPAKPVIPEDADAVPAENSTAPAEQDTAASP